ncbi:hypothetical protein FKM82_009642 [Ascaphus truei]
MTKISQRVSTMASETPGSAVSMVGQGTVLGKSSLFMVGYLGKIPDSCTNGTDGCCPACKAKGQIQALRTYRISFTQSIFLCANPQCIYPLGYTPLDNIITNTADVTKHCSPNKHKKRKILETSITNQVCGKKTRNDASVCGEYLSSHDFSFPQNGVCMSPPALTTPACEMSGLFTPLHNVQNGNTELLAQNEMETAKALSSDSTVLDVNHVSLATSIVPKCELSKPPNLLQTDDWNECQEGAAQNVVLEMTKALNRGPVLLQDGDTVCLAPAKMNEENEHQKSIVQSAGMEIASALSGDPDETKNGNHVSHSASAQTVCETSNTPCLLQDNLPKHQEKVEQNVLMEISSPLRNKAAVQNCSNESLAPPSVPDCELSEPCDSLQDSPDEQCEIIKQNVVVEVASPVKNSDLQNTKDLSEAASLVPERELKMENVVRKENHRPVTISAISNHQTTNGPTVILSPEAQWVAKQTPVLLTNGAEYKHLQWTNKYALCWLDCIMCVLVQSDTLRKAVAAGCTDKESVIHTLFTKYNEATELLTSSAKNGRNGDANKIVLAEMCLDEVRVSVFEGIKPILKCELGQNESPVFAFPLLLQQDRTFEALFDHSYSWTFACALCGYKHQERCQKTLTTFTKIVPEWQPLNAAHKAPCNNCQDSAQKRTMILEKVNSMFMCHFVEGLPHNDLKLYSFQFEGHLYEISMVIRYQSKHFSAWIANLDGTWLESDDLNGPYGSKHKNFGVPPAEMHIVIWERNPSKTIEEKDANPCTVEAETPALNSTTISPSCPGQTLDPSSLIALPIETVSIPTSTLSTSNRSNLLSGLEGYADDDIITLTLVQIPFDSVGIPLQNNLVPELDGTYAGQVQANIHSTSPSESLSDGAQFEVPNNCMMLPEHLYQASQASAILSSESTKSHLQNSTPHAEGIMQKPCSVKQNNYREESNSGTSATTATSSAILNSTKKGVVGSWIKSLLNKNPSFLASNLYGSNKKNINNCPKPPSLLKVTDQHVACKKAENFGGFTAKGTRKTINTVDSNVCSLQNTNGILPSALYQRGPDHNAGPPKDKASKPVGTFLAPTASNQTKRGRNGIDYGKMLAKNGSSASEDKIRRLRLKMLKKLKAKKNELASLEMLAKAHSNEESPRSNQIKHFSQYSSLNRREQLRGLLQELQEQIDNADNESVCTMSSSTSLCSSPGDADFFADLFSPVATDVPGGGSDDSRFFEMLVDGGYGSSLPSCQTDGLCNEGTELKHDRCSFKDNQSLLQATSANNSFIESSTKEDVLNDLLSSSTLEVLNDHNEYFPPFDDIYF